MMRPTGRSSASAEIQNFGGDDHPVQILDGFHLHGPRADAIARLRRRQGAHCRPGSRSIGGCGRRAGPRNCRCGECGTRPPPRDARAAARAGSRRGRGRRVRCGRCAPPLDRRAWPARRFPWECRCRPSSPGIGTSGMTKAKPSRCTLSRPAANSRLEPVATYWPDRVSTIAPLLSQPSRARLRRRASSRLAATARAAVV